MPTFPGEEKMEAFTYTAVYHDGTFVRNDRRYIRPIRDDGRRTVAGAWGPRRADQPRSPSGELAIVMACDDSSRATIVHVSNGKAVGRLAFPKGSMLQW